MASNNKLVQTVSDSVVLSGILAGVGWVSKKAFKDNLTPDPSGSLMSFIKLTGALAIAIYAKGYLEKEKILPTPS